MASAPAVFTMCHLLSNAIKTAFQVENSESLNLIKTHYFTLHILIKSNELQQYAGVYLLQNYSTCFGCLSHASSGVHQSVTAVSGTGHSVRATTFRQRGLIKSRWRKGVAAVTVLCTPDDG